MLGSVELDQGKAKKSQSQVSSELVAFVMAMTLPAEFLLKSTKYLFYVGTDAVDLQHLFLGELDGIGAKVEITPAKHFDQET